MDFVYEKLAAQTTQFFDKVPRCIEPLCAPPQ
jgi:hypothetical protein